LHDALPIYLDRLSELLVPTLLGVPRVRRRVDLHGRAEERERPDAHGADVEDHAVEVEEHPLSELDVRAVVTVERRLDRHRVPARPEELARDPPTLLPRRF